MKITAAVALATATLAVMVRVVSALDETKGRTVVHISPKDAKWDTGPRPGIMRIPLRGDGSKGAHACYTKFAPAQDNGWHTHTNDICLVGVSGAYVLKDAAGGEIRVGPGEFLLIPAGTKHWSGADVREGAVFYESSPGKFDINTIDAPKK
ncbi:MAG: cupin domain-containing protein [Planctomycetota bacterium]